MINWIVKHPYLTLESIFGILFVFGWLMSFENPYKALMIFSVIAALIAGFAGIADWYEKNIH